MAELNSAPRTAIVADDLTGALDCAAAFAAPGMATYVAVGTQHPIDTDADVISVNADSRRLSGIDASNAVADAANLAAAAGAEVRYVKIDSSMRGHPGIELQTLNGSGVILFTPAFPANGRTVVAGDLMIDGVPLTETEVGRDQLSPATSSRVGEILRLHYQHRVNELPLQTVRSGNLTVSLGEQDLQLNGAGSNGSVISCDAETDEDLDRLISAGFKLEQELPEDERFIVFGGSAGLASALARRVAAAGTYSLTQNTVSAEAPVLIVTASQRTLVDQQIATLVSSGTAELHPLEFIVNGKGEVKPGSIDTEAIRAALSGRRNTVLRATITTDISSLAPETIRRAADELTRLLGEAVAGLVSQHHIGGLVIIGGDTAHAVLTAVNARGIVLAAEPLPGVPVGTIIGGALDGIPVATKAGAFGNEQTLVDLFQYLGRSK